MHTNEFNMNEMQMNKNIKPASSPLRAVGAPMTQRHENDRIDPSQLPRFNERRETCVYSTRSTTLPPPAASDYMALDEGNASPRFIRMTTNIVPDDASLVSKSKISVGAVIQPLAETHSGEISVQTIDPNTLPNGMPVRCDQCHAYVNPFFQFLENGNVMICNLCKKKQNVPEQYRCTLDQDGFRLDRFNRPELHRGSIEYIAPASILDIQKKQQERSFHQVLNDNTSSLHYSVETAPSLIPKVIDHTSLKYVFLFDVTESSIMSGFLACALESARKVVMSLFEANPTCQIALLAYDQTIYFANLKNHQSTVSGGSEASGINFSIMTDVADPFLPLSAKDAFVSAKDNGIIMFSKALDTLSMIFLQKTSESISRNSNIKTRFSKVSAFGAGCEAAYALLVDAGGAGKVLGFQTSMTTFGAGLIPRRLEPDSYTNPAKEKSLYVPSTEWYRELTVKSAKLSIAYDIFIALDNYSDLATTTFLTNGTGGQLYLYPHFSAAENETALYKDLLRNVSRLTGFNCTLTVRVSEGLQVADYYGNFYRGHANELSFATLDADKSLGITFMHTGKIETKLDAKSTTSLTNTLSASKVTNFISSALGNANTNTVSNSNTNMNILSNTNTNYQSTTGSYTQTTPPRPVEVCFQVALLYITSFGQSRIRVHTLSLPVSSDIATIFRHADLDAIVNISLKQAVDALFTTNTCIEIQDRLTNACLDSLLAYRKFCAAKTSASQLILPDALKLLPLCTLGLVKNSLFKEGLNADERTVLFNYVNSMPAHISVAFICPRLYCITTLQPHDCVPVGHPGTGLLGADAFHQIQHTSTNEIFNVNQNSFTEPRASRYRVQLPASLSLNSKTIYNNHIYLLDDTRCIYIWVGSDVSEELKDELFNITLIPSRSTQNIQASAPRRILSIKQCTPEDNVQSARVKLNTMLSALQSCRAYHQNIYVVETIRPSQDTANMMGYHPTKRMSAEEVSFFKRLIEDNGDAPKKGTVKMPKDMSYIDFLCWAHKRITLRLSG